MGKINEVVGSCVEDVEGLDRAREQLLPLCRDIIRLCSHGIVSLHRTEDVAVTDVKEKMNELREYEHKYPDTFTGLYQFWCQKKQPDSLCPEAPFRQPTRNLES